MAGTAALEPWEIKTLQDDHKRGTTVEALAERYGVHRRTIYRYLACRIERVFIDGWTAWFALAGEGKAPQRLTAWEPA